MYAYVTAYRGANIKTVSFSENNCDKDQSYFSIHVYTQRS